MKEMHSGRVFAFQDTDGTYVLDKANSKAYKTDANLGDTAELQKLIDSFGEPQVDKELNLPYMRAQLCVTHLCNFKCSYCDLDGENTYKKDALMSLETGKKAVGTILSYKPEHVKNVLLSFTSNGETLTNWGMVRELIDHCEDTAKSNDFKFSYNFASNATMLTDKIIDEILERQNLNVFFSLDGRENVHDRLRHYRCKEGSTYNDAVGGIKAFMEKAKVKRPGKAISSSTVLTTYNMDFNDIYDHLLGLGFGRIVTRPVRGPREWEFALSDATLPLFKESYDNFYKALREGADSGDNGRLNAMAPVYDFFGRPFYMLLLNERKFHGCPHCPPGTKDLKLFSVTFDSNGDIISPCRDLIGNEQFKVGTLEKGFDDAKLKGITTFHNEDKQSCSECWDEFVCGGGCNLQAYYATKDIAKPDPVMCDLTRHATKLSMKLLTHIEEAQPELYKKLKEKGQKSVPWHYKYE